MNPITSTVTHTVDLGSPSYPSPPTLVIAPGGEVYPAAAGATGVYSDVSGVSLTLDASIAGSGTKGGLVFGGAGSGSTNGGIAVDLSAQATVTNYNGIYGGIANTGDNAGVAVSMTGGGTLINYNNIEGGSVNTGTGSGGTAVVMAGGMITNDGGLDGGSTVGFAAGAGGDGLDLSAGGVVTNEAAINGGGGGIAGVGVSLTSGAELINDPGAAVFGGITRSTLMGAAVNGAAVTASDSIVKNYAILYGGNGGGDFSGTGGTGLELLSSSTATNDGTIYGGSGGLDAAGGIGVYLASGSLTNSGTIDGGVGYAGGAGGVGVDFSGGTLTDSGTIKGGVANGVTADSVKFGSEPLTMTLKSGAAVTGDIGGFTVTNDTIDISNWKPTESASTYFNGSDTALTTSDGTLEFAYSLTGHYEFSADSGNTGTDLIITSTVAACYRRGTHIRTPAGDVAIETLRIGDAVLTASGESRPIRWIGRRSYSAAFAANNDAITPILIRAGALAENLPQRDLWVSPEHAMWLDGVLIPARALVNKVSIIREAVVAGLTYLHLEFDTHEVIFAEGSPSESFVDDESREQFDNAREYWLLYPEAIRGPARFCAARVEDGEELETVLRRLRVGVLTSHREHLRPILPPSR